MPATAKSLKSDNDPDSSREEKNAARAVRLATAARRPRAELSPKEVICCIVATD